MLSSVRVWGELSGCPHLSKGLGRAVGFHAQVYLSAKMYVSYGDG